MTYKQALEMLPPEMTITCACGRSVQLQVEGGQYPEFYAGTCECGLRWQLINLNVLFDAEDTPHFPPVPVQEE